MEKILVTGFSGFVSRHFLNHLEEKQLDTTVLGVSRGAPGFSCDQLRHVRCTHRSLDLLDKEGVADVLGTFRPTHILHLAAYSSVGFSWQRPVDSFANNTNVLLNLLEQIRALDLPCRVLSVGSSEEYGNVSAAELPLKEDSELRPVSPYAVARVAQEMLSRVYVQGYGLDISMTRSFNHIGAYQREAFVVPSLAKQLTAIRYAGATPRVVTGDRRIVRDFVDVRDVVRAYFDLLTSAPRGEIFNVCSGRGTSIDEIVQTLQELLGVDVELVTDMQLVRPNDNAVVVGSNAKIQSAIGWVPSIALRDSLATILGSVRE